MHSRRIGSTGLALSEIAFGCGGNAGLMVRGIAGEQERAVGRALDLGITYFDNSPDYGDGRAEEALGRALKALKARPLVNSKVEIRAENLPDIAGHVERSVDASLTRLGLDHLDVLQIHNGPSARRPVILEGRSYARLGIDDYFRPGGAIDGVERVLRAGKARFAGFICRGDDGEEVRRVLATGVFHLINVPYTLLNPTAGRNCPPGLIIERDYGDVLTAARELGAGAAIYSPLAGGFLTDDFADNSPRHPLARPARGEAAALEMARRRVRALRAALAETGLTLAQAAIRFCLMHEGVTTVLGGFSSIEQIEEAVAAANTPPFDAEVIGRLEMLWSRGLD